MDQENNIKALVYKNENKYYWFVLFISIISYIFLALSVVGIFIILGMILISLFFHGLMIARIRTNAVKLSPAQFPKVYERTKELCEKMKIKQVPDVYVMESGGILNAFATRFFGRNMVVLYSEFFELIERDAEDEVTFVIAHELAHIKRNHISKMLFIMPSMFIPGIAEMYLRACEYTCDRYAAFFIGNPEAAKNGLTVLAIGKTLYRHVDRYDFVKQVENEKGFFVWFSEILSTHPPLPKRIHEIDVFFEDKEPAVYKNLKLKWVFIPITLIGCGLIYAGGNYTLGKLETFLNEDFEETFEPIDGEDNPPLIVAVVNGDTSKVESLIDNGEDIQVEDFGGLTPLHWAVLDGNEQLVSLLIERGADPNYENYDSITPLMSAAENGDTVIAKILLTAGGDPNLPDIEGMTSLFYAVFSENPEMVTLMLDSGADASQTDNMYMSALMHAIQLKDRDIVTILKNDNE
ncbi:ankyrin repeat domain-containing protein [Fictibacillus nanhaiensis]|uniref:M48 family metallopeptidase n=1 Tax=Fictibacillus nanhaiensis TaxID=742169 RepID=UPI001C97C758|nr:ankyrin repeat domain-containing protein [Fictibacillus nanhaiensis]MBY6036982.1 ankyrin repeat domain-containing protein [Fictibacillus nanhaiensis]